MSPQKQRLFDAELSLLDRQVIDVGDVPVVVVSEVELSDDVVLGEEIPIGTRAPTITALLSGPVLATRIFGGRPPRSRLHAIPWSEVTEIGIAISIGVTGETLDVTWSERWVSEHIISRIPGGTNDPE
jgi:hypothetical protein